MILHECCCSPLLSKARSLASRGCGELALRVVLDAWGPRSGLATAFLLEWLRRSLLLLKDVLFWFLFQLDLRWKQSNMLLGWCRSEIQRLCCFTVFDA